jgi:hypothetical protein
LRQRKHYRVVGQGQVRSRLFHVRAIILVSQLLEFPMRDKDIEGFMRLQYFRLLDVAIIIDAGRSGLAKTRTQAFAVAGHVLGAEAI